MTFEFVVRQEEEDGEREEWNKEKQIVCHLPCDLLKKPRRKYCREWEIWDARCHPLALFGVLIIELKLFIIFSYLFTLSSKWIWEREWEMMTTVKEDLYQFLFQFLLLLAPPVFWYFLISVLYLFNINAHMRSFYFFFVVALHK